MSAWTKSVVPLITIVLLSLGFISNQVFVAFANPCSSESGRNDFITRCKTKTVGIHPSPNPSPRLTGIKTDPAATTTVVVTTATVTTTPVLRRHRGSVFRLKVFHEVRHGSVRGHRLLRAIPTTVAAALSLRFRLLLTLRGKKSGKLRFLHRRYS